MFTLETCPAESNRRPSRHSMSAFSQFPMTDETCAQIVVSDDEVRIGLDESLPVAVALTISPLPFP
jgi:hypothetical protein